ncbi:MAG: hypothetical protein M0R17_05090 [Candidatus Omnitrophica bacterium]|jgi:DNA polymerase|nr:hypothetical protein [Candidatus Omnitrophota bacterium]
MEKTFLNLEKECPAKCQYIYNCDRLPTEVIKHNDKQIDILFYGIGSGVRESELKQAFVGPAGCYLRSVIKHLWDTYKIFNIALTNNVRNHPLDSNNRNREPTLDEISLCKHHLEHDIDRLKPKVIIPLGRCAASTFYNFGDLGIGKIRGSIYPIRINDVKYQYLPTYHPSFLLRTYGKFIPANNQSFDIKFIDDIKLALSL